MWAPSVIIAHDSCQSFWLQVPRLYQQDEANLVKIICLPQKPCCKARTGRTGNRWPSRSGQPIEPDEQRSVVNVSSSVETSCLCFVLVSYVTVRLLGIHGVKSRHS
ncbi:hypothetical protein M9H77_16531 [Catharanthus roseus]|uniref:Uncharacterized protein n=1 Tax=Catharanthus roseus TaxID=4058 RepID=A0ACC0B207_CATRO|nr:hypothetical protein M9H77_16531 [Catharanthus roseus]